MLFIDTDGDGSLGNERPVHDYLIAREVFAWTTRKATPNITLAANFRETRGVPALDLYFDTSAHGSHVAGIAAAHDMYGVKGFDGVAPGAQLLGLKIANDAQGGISTTGSMLRAMDYAISFAHQRRMPLVLNMSFGVGNEAEGKARIDQLIDSVLHGPSRRGIHHQCRQRRTGALHYGIPRIRHSGAHRRGDLPCRDDRLRPRGRPATRSPTSAPGAGNSPSRTSRRRGSPIPRCPTGTWAMSGRAGPAWPRLMPPDWRRCSPRPSSSGARRSTPA